MRLICPNCGAQYEVDDSVIPAEGRDVQCSDCGQTWFQPAAAATPEPQPAPEPVAEPTLEPAPEAMPEMDAEDEEYTEDTVVPEDDEPSAADLPPPDTIVSFDQDDETFYEFDSDETAETAADDQAAESGPAAKAEPEETPDNVDDADAEPDPEDSTDAENDDAESAIAGLLAGEFGEVQVDEASTPPRRALDEDVVNVLREEAQHEQRARAADENDTLFGGQREMGLAGAAVTPLVSGEDDADDLHDRDSGSRRDLLPDIEEINSTLRATSERHGQFNSDDEIAPDHEMEPRSNSFGRSFSMVIILAGLLVALYIMAPTIKEKVPASASVLDTYTSGVDAGRLALDNLLRSLVEKMTDGQGADPQ